MKRTIISIAQKRGSAATTKSGAWRFLLARLPKPITGYNPDTYERNADAAQQYRDDIYERRADRIIAGLPLWSRADAQQLADELTQAYIGEQCRLNTNWPLKRSQSSWAGGDHHVSISLSGAPSASGWSTQEWSSNQKWSGTDSHVKLDVTLGALSWFPSLRTPDGMIIIDAEKLGPREFHITWVEQGRGFSLRAVNGYLIRGYHVRAVSLQAAKQKVATARSAALDNAIKARIVRRADREYNTKLAGVMVSIEDSIVGGNCPQGTEQARKQLVEQIGDIGGISAAELLHRRNDNYTQRAIRAAYNRIYHHSATSIYAA